MVQRNTFSAFDCTGSAVILLNLYLVFSHQLFVLRAVKYLNTELRHKYNVVFASLDYRGMIILSENRVVFLLVENQLLLFLAPVIHYLR